MNTRAVLGVGFAWLLAATGCQGVISGGGDLDAAGGDQDSRPFEVGGSGGDPPPHDTAGGSDSDFPGDGPGLGDPSAEPDPCADGEPASNETGLDCGGVCPPCERGDPCADDSDCQSNACQHALCVASHCQSLIQDADETGVDCGGACPACPGATCSDPAECASGVCTAELCQDPRCDDGVPNGSETGTDCGGTCPPCPAESPCQDDGDCASNVCVALQCQAATCEDETHNGNETDQDCGGPCPPCGIGDTCAEPGDCGVGMVCLIDVCAPQSCQSGGVDGGESDADCGGPCPPCAIGLACTGDQECESHTCMDAICRPTTCRNDLQDPDESDTDCGGLCPLCDDESSCTEDGDCTSNICEATVCIAACSPTNTDGACRGQVTTFDPVAGPQTVDAVCCDPDVRAVTGCQLGTCDAPACAADQPTGSCGLSQFCDAGFCVVAPCSSHHPAGFCDPGKLCIGHACRIANCAGQDDPDAYCAPYICDDVLDVCVRPPCGAGHPEGFCATIGEVCRDGACAVPHCSVEFPGGNCPPGQICYGGSCSSPPCSADYPNGTCGPNFTCVAGTCELAPCSPTAPQGSCPAGERCSLGTCKPHQCSPDFPTAPCPVGQLCQHEGCAEGPPCCAVPDCSNTYPGGKCLDGEICSGGRCVPQPCSSTFPNGACGPGSICVDGACEQAPCNLDEPTGACALGQVCHHGACVDPACGVDFPDGPCPDPGDECIATICQVPRCDALHPGGACDGRNEICIDGSCILPACSVAVPNGQCAAATQVCCDTDLEALIGCSLGSCTLPPCDASNPTGGCYGVEAGKVCHSGSCVDYVCGTEFPDGPCPPGQECVVELCQWPPCDALHPGGRCPGVDEICVGGSCILPGCSPAATNGQCPGSEDVCCDASLLSTIGCSVGTCVLSPCDPAHINGGCYGADAGRVCLAGTCVDDVCGADFPDGPCPPGEQCNAGLCEVPPCGPAHPGGTCAGLNEICVAGACTLPPCSVTVQNGQCATGQTCCDGDLEGERGCALGTCVPEACSAANDGGYCLPSEVCCSQELFDDGYCGIVGDCVGLACSTAFPFADCTGPDAGKTCIGGSCVFLCDESHRQGFCATGFACVALVGVPPGQACRPDCPGDADCDNISDLHEGTDDTDADGAPDARDLDSDNDMVADAVEAGDNALATAPVDTDSDGAEDFRDTDSDNDHMSDSFEAVTPSAPRDTDGDGIPDLRDDDSDDDGILDACEAADGASGICSASGLLADAAIVDSDGDGLRDFLDVDSDGDGIEDSIEARDRPANAGTLNAAGVDHDADGVPDYRDLDSDNDSVPDAEEDVDGNGVVDCQVDGGGSAVPDHRPSPACGALISWAGPTPPARTYSYDYNPGCAAASVKCLLAESSRVHPDSEGDGIGDDTDGIYLACGTEQLKPVNLFFSQQADYAVALEPSFTASAPLRRGGGAIEAGFTFSDTVDDNGSYAVGGFLVQRVPDSVAIVENTLIDKALAQESADRGRLASAQGVQAISLVLSRNFTSFDGYGVVVARYDILTTSTVQVAGLRDNLAASLEDPSDPITGFAGTFGPSSDQFTLFTQTLYRYDTDNPALPEGSVLVLGALAPTYNPTQQSLAYRTRCGEQSGSAACSTHRGCRWEDCRSWGTATECDTQYLCQWSGGACEPTGGTALCTEDDTYQVPLFFADNIGSGSAIAQYGDDLGTICQSLVQASGKVDFLWVTDASGSMVEENDQLRASAGLFFGILQNTEADYRVAQTMAHEPRSRYGHRNESTTSNDPWPVNNRFDPCPGRDDGDWGAAGCLLGNFTGSLLFGDPANRDAQWDCNNPIYGPGCGPTAYDCDACGSGLIEAPECYFAARLTCGNTNGDDPVPNAASEMPLLMAQWAMYRAGLANGCEGGDSATCEIRAECYWDGSGCQANTCTRDPVRGGLVTENECETDWGSDVVGQRIGCLWDANSGLCVPNYTCDDYGNEPVCYDGAVNNQPTFVDVLCDGSSRRDCRSGGDCRWDDCRAWGNSDECAAHFGCLWGGGVCVPASGTGVCRPPLKRMIRPDAHPVLVIMTDEEDCYLKDRLEDPDYEGEPNCGQQGFRDADACWNTLTDNSAYDYDDPIRLARQQAYARYFQSRGVTTFAVVGDASSNAGAGCNSGGCRRYDLGGSVFGWQDPSSAPPGLDTTDPCGEPGNECISVAQPGNGMVAVTEQTGGGWGSICAGDLYPSIEAIIIGSLGIASPYKLEGFIDGSTVQPIAATIQVAVEVCSVPAEYPACPSGTQMRVVPRSRDNGFDYDVANNTLVLYGSGRPALEGDIVVSYRYWIDNAQPPMGNPDCPCPQTSLPGCACPPGQACGVGVCDGLGSRPGCEGAAGCVWNEATGCLANGICEPDPSCGGSCGSNAVCDPGLGLCVCDVSCGSGCSDGQMCDNNANVNGCQGLAQLACNAQPDCSFDAVRSACYSDTCGQCLCDITCGGGCLTGHTCDADLGSATCGQCLCDITCGGGCPGTQVCDQEPASATCGFCRPPECSPCDLGEVCDPATGDCVCDTTCQGGCPNGQACDDNPASGSCGLCACDLSCGGGTCPGGQVCDNDPASTTCGLCRTDPSCGVSGDCNDTCAAADADACAGLGGCRWAPWLAGGAGDCVPARCEICNPVTGFCEADATCCGACDPLTEQCNPSTGECECDTACGSGCLSGQLCDSDPDSVSCAECVCDTSCGGECPLGQVCDSDPSSGSCGLCQVDPGCGVGGGCNADCTAGVNESSCTPLPECRWAAWASSGQGQGACVPTACQVCNPTRGLCETDDACSDCACDPAHEACNPSTGQCECDISCGGGCLDSQICDDDPASATCGQCFCDTTCEGGCLAGQLCDSDPDAATCGLCQVDSSCGVGGDCNTDCKTGVDESTCLPLAGCRWAPWVEGGTCVPVRCEVCNPSTGLCETDGACCGACYLATETCNPSTGQCECDTHCGFACAPGLTCDGSSESPTCGQCVCDTTCGGGCPEGLSCDDNADCAPNQDATSCTSTPDCAWDNGMERCVSIFCGACVVECGECPEGETCDPTTGLCVPTCPPCETGTVCDPLTGTCVCDQTCGEACPMGKLCDDDLESSTCGECVCDTACGGDCPSCQICDADPGSATCGVCVIDSTCGGGCSESEVCDSEITGCCMTDPNCGGLCVDDTECNPVTGQCEETPGD